MKKETTPRTPPTFPVRPTLFFSPPPPPPANLYIMPLCSWLFNIHVVWYTVVNVHQMSLPPSNKIRLKFAVIYIYFRGLMVYTCRILWKVKVPYHVVKASERSRGLPPFLTSAVNGVEGSTIRPGRCTLGEGTTCANWIGYYRILLDWINRHKHVRLETDPSQFRPATCIIIT